MKWIVAAALLVLNAWVPAGAAIITRSFTIDATGFGTGAAYQRVTGTFGVTFDNGFSSSGVTSGLTVSGYTLPLAPTDFSYSAAGDLLTIGFGTRVAAAGATSCGLDVSQSCLKLRQISGTPMAISFQYNDGSVRSGQVTVADASAAVPEPATWAMFIGGFGLVGAMLRRRGRELTAVA
jgi:hypothetical protein